MRLVVLLVPPVVLSLPFLACGGGSATPADAGIDMTVVDTGGDQFTTDVAFSSDTGLVSHCKLGDADPVGLCTQKLALNDLHTHAFAADSGAAVSWSSITETADRADGGRVAYSGEDTVAYAAAASNYLASAEIYGDTTINAGLIADLTTIALLLETGAIAPASTTYSGEYYAHLRTTAAGLRTAGLTTDGNHIDSLANLYGRAIFASHFFSLGAVGSTDAGSGDAAVEGGLDGAADATTHDAATHDASGHDASAHDAGLVDGAGAHDGSREAATASCTGDDAGAPLTGDGIFGNAIGGGQVAYSTADVATAAYAILDLVNRNPTDCMVPRWLQAVRIALDHLEAHAHEPTTRMYYASLIAGRAEAGSVDALGTSTVPGLPSDAVLADTQATLALTLIRAQYLVTTGSPQHDAGTPDGAIVDSGLTGPFISVLDIPFEARADAAIAAMNGTHSLWDGPVKKPGAGYVDGYIPSTSTLITTKSTRPNALMGAAIWRGVATNLNPYGWQLPSLIPLLLAQQTAPVGSNLFTVVDNQQAYFQTVSKAFALLDAGPYRASYTSAAVAAAVEGLTEQLFEESP